MSQQQLRNILVPLDGSVRAEHAIPLAARLARAAGGTLVFVRVVLPLVTLGVADAAQAAALVPETLQDRQIKAEHYLAHVTRTYAQELSGIHVISEVDTGSAASTICSVACLEQIDLIVLCSHGTHDLLHRIFGSVAQEAIRQSPAPMLVLNEKGGKFLEADQAKALRLLVTLDGSPLSEAVLQPALHLATALATPARAELHLLRVVDLPSVDGKTLLHAYQIQHQREVTRQEAEAYLQQVTHRLEEQIPATLRPAITWSVRITPHVAHIIARTAEPPEHAEQGDDYALLAMATHGRSGFQRLVTGSVTEQVLGETRLPLLIVRPPQVASKQQQQHLEMAI